MKIQCTQTNSKIPTPHHLITNLAYRLKAHHKRNQYLITRLDAYADVNIMPASVYKLAFQDCDCKKLAPSKLEIGTYTTDIVKLFGSCVFYLAHPDTKCLQVTFYVVSSNGSILLSCVTMLALGLIQHYTRLDCLHPRASLITSSADHPKTTKSEVSVHVSRKESEVSTVSNCKGMVSKLITSKEQILHAYSDVFDDIGCFPCLPYHIQVDPSVTSKQTPCQLVPVHLKESFKREIIRCYKWKF